MNKERLSRLKPKISDIVRVLEKRKKPTLGLFGFFM
jgi:hypothetical protein